MGREFSFEDSLEDLFRQLVEDDPTIVSDSRRMQNRAKDSRPVTSHRTPLGMQREGTMRLMGSIPVTLWRADEILRPELTSEERARDLLRRFPVLSVEGTAKDTSEPFVDLGGD